MLRYIPSTNMLRLYAAMLACLWASSSGVGGDGGGGGGGAANRSNACFSHWLTKVILLPSVTVISLTVPLWIAGITMSPWLTNNPLAVLRPLSVSRTLPHTCSTRARASRRLNARDTAARALAYFGCL